MPECCVVQCSEQRAIVFIFRRGLPGNRVADILDGIITSVFIVLWIIQRQNYPVKISLFLRLHVIRTFNIIKWIHSK